MYKTINFNDIVNDDQLPINYLQKITEVVAFDFELQTANYIIDIVNEQKTIHIIEFVDIDVSNEESTLTLMKVLSRFKELISLKFISTKLNVQVLSCLSDNIVKNSQLTVLELHDVVLYPNAIEVFAKALTSCNKLTTLVLSNNNMGSTGGQILIPSLPNTIKVLNLQKSNLDLKAIQILSNKLPALTDLKYLNLQTNNIDFEKISILSAGLAQCKNLAALIMDGNPISNEGITCLMSALVQCSKFKSLDLSSIGLNQQGRITLSESLSKLIQLTTLILRDNIIDAYSMQFLAPALAQCIYLRALNLDETQIDQYGAQHLATYLPQLMSLAILTMASNNISSEGMQAITKVLPNCSTIINLNFEDNNIDDTELQALATVIRLCPTLHTLLLKQNNILQKGRDAIHSALVNNSYIKIELDNDFIDNIDDITALNLLHQDNYDYLLTTVHKVAEYFRSPSQLTNVKRPSKQDLDLMLEQQNFIKNHIVNDTLLLESFTYFRKHFFTIYEYENVLVEMINNKMIINEWSADEQQIITPISLAQLYNKLQGYKNIHFFMLNIICKGEKTQAHNSFAGSAFQELPLELICKITDYLLFKDVQQIQELVSLNIDDTISLLNNNKLEFIGDIDQFNT